MECVLAESPKNLVVTLTALLDLKYHVTLYNMHGKVMVTSHMLCSSSGDDLDIKNAGVRASV